MNTLLRNSLFGIVLVCSAVIGVRVYLDSQNQPPADTIETGAATAATLPDTLPEFTLNDIWGEPRSISEWSGKPLLINFWATWCAPCRREMPLLQALHTSQSDLQVLGIAIDRRPDVQSFLAESGITYPSLVGETDAMKVADLFGLGGLGLPFSALIGSGGEVLTVFVGEIEAPELEEMAAVSRAFESQTLSFAEARSRLGEL